MLHRHEAHDEPNPTPRDLVREAAPAVARPLADREVPLPGATAADARASVINAWLDGEATEGDARLADARSVDFWKRVDLDTDRLRRTKSPAQFAASVMAAIPVKEL